MEPDLDHFYIVGVIDGPGHTTFQPCSADMMDKADGHDHVVGVMLVDSPWLDPDAFRELIREEGVHDAVTHAFYSGAIGRVAEGHLRNLSGGGSS